MISKELLSEELLHEVLKIDNILEYRLSVNTLWVTDSKSHCGAMAYNIYELAHKCKEWALIKHGFTITSFIFRIDAYPSGEYDGAAIIFFPDNETPSIRFDETTISEAIFKACQWILDNKETK